MAAITGNQNLKEPRHSLLLFHSMATLICANFPPFLSPSSPIHGRGRPAGRRIELPPSNLAPEWTPSLANSFIRSLKVLLIKNVSLLKRKAAHHRQVTNQLARAAFLPSILPSFPVPVYSLAVPFGVIKV